MAAVLDALTPRRLVTAAVILAIIGLSVVGLQKVKDERAATCGAGQTGASPIKQLEPCPGDTDLRQGRIGVALADGYTAQLYVDGTFIPEDQLQIEGATVTYIPGPDKITGALRPGLHQAKVVYYKLLQDPTQGTAYTWAFSTH